MVFDSQLTTYSATLEATAPLAPRLAGQCFDHALVESFNATLECELIDRRDWKTRAQARREVFYWIEAVYNRTRRHSALGYLSPVEYEATLSMTPTTSDPST